MSKKSVIFNLLEYFRIPDNATLLVHSSFKGFKRDGYTVEDVLAALVEYMHPGTLLMPTMSWRFVNINKPKFYELDTPCNTGVLAEMFRTEVATHRSLHPTHSVAGIGNKTSNILGTHQFSKTPCDQNSPSIKMLDPNAFIIMMGVGIDCCTMIHAAEEAIAPEIYAKPPTETEVFECIDRNNKLHNIELIKHKFLARNYWKVQDELAKQSKLLVYKCDNNIVLGFKAQDVFDISCALLETDPCAILAQQGDRYRMM